MRDNREVQIRVSRKGAKLAKENRERIEFIVSPRSDSVKTNVLGRTGLPVSVLGFGCGFVGGLMVQGSPAEQDAAVAHAEGRPARRYFTLTASGATALAAALDRYKALRPIPGFAPRRA